MNDPLQDQQQANHLRNYKPTWADKTWDVVFAILAGIVTYVILYLLSEGAN